jgi:hypothetical protein
VHGIPGPQRTDQPRTDRLLAGEGVEVVGDEDRALRAVQERDHREVVVRGDDRRRERDGRAGADQRPDRGPVTGDVPDVRLEAARLPTSSRSWRRTGSG